HRTDVCHPRFVSPKTPKKKGETVRALKPSARFLSVFALVLSAALLGTAGISVAANPLLCFSGTADTAAGTTGGVIYGGTCTLSPDGMSAVLNNSVPVGSGDYSGVYYATSNLSGELVSDITQLSFDYSGSTATAGSPRISLPIDTNNNGTTDFFLFISASQCSNGR